MSLKDRLRLILGKKIAIGFFFLLLFTIITSNPIKWLMVIAYLPFVQKEILAVFRERSYIAVPWFLFLVVVILSMSWSISLPISLIGFIDQSSFFFIFLLFLIVIKKVGIKFTLEFVSTSAFLLMVANVIFLLLPFDNPLSASTDIIWPSFGHNHMASISILLIPLHFYLYIRNQNVKNLVFLLLSLLILLTSGGRILITLGLFQIVFLMLIWKKQRLHIGKVTKVIILSFFSILILILTWYFNLSSTHDFCDTYSTWWCKPLLSIDREGYMQSALLGTLEKPILGSGINTYPLISKKYAENSGSFSYYAHSFPLQVSSELGLFGLALMSLFFLVVAKKIALSSKKLFFIDHYHISLTIGLLFSFLNSLFDYDWNVATSLLFTIAVLAIVVSRTESDQRDSLFVKQFNLLFFRPSTIKILSMVLSIAVFVYLAQVILTGLGKPDYSCQLFPANQYMYGHYISGQHGFVSEKCLIKTDKHFLNDPYYWQYKSNNTNSIEDRISSQFQLMKVSPWSSFSNNLLNYYIETNQEVNAVEYISTLVANYNTILKSDSNRDRERHYVVLNLIKFADYLFLRDQYYLSGHYLKVAHSIDPWALSYNKPVIATAIANDLQELDYYKQIATIEPSQLLQQSQFYSDYFLSLAVVLVLNSYDSSETLSVIKRASDMAEKVNFHLWSRLLWAVEQNTKTLQDSQRYEERLDEIHKYLLFLVSTSMRHDRAQYYDDRYSDDISRISTYLINLSRLFLWREETSIAYDYAKISTRFNDDLSPLKALPGLLCESLMNLDCAQKEYEECTDSISKNNFECSEGLRRILNNQPDRNRYWLVSERAISQYENK